MKVVSPFAAQHSLFRAYDIRGDHHYFTVEFVHALSRAFAELYHSQSYKAQDKKSRHNHPLKISLNPAHESKTNTVVIGYDVRCGSDVIAQTLADILQKRGLTIINLGLVTTPMMAFWAQQYAGHGIMVTASHSAKDILGIKWLVDNTSPSSLEIQALYQQLDPFNLQLTYSQKNNLHNYGFQKPSFQTNNKIQGHSFNSKSISYSDNSSTNLPAELIASTYIEAIAQVFKHINQRTINKNRTTQHNIDLLTSNLAKDDHQHLTESQHTREAKLDLTLVIDCMNGATSNIAQPLFERFCQRVIMLNDSPDGNFPIGNPDPTEPNRLAELQQTVIVNEADMGFAFDGDGDRLMVVDNSGKVITADQLLYLLAQVAITESAVNLTDSQPVPTVLFDIKCSHHLSQLLSNLGAMPIMTKTGSSLLRQQLQTSEQQPIFAGELSGHFIFNDGYFIAYDDAMYAGLRLLHWLTHTAPILDSLAAPMDSNSSSKATPITTNLWGEPRSVIPPYQLTDITKNLPVLVSSADHYLPLNKLFLIESKGDRCTFIEHLVEYCRYLQRLVDDSTADEISMQKSVFAQSISCGCFSPKPPILKTKAQAEQLLPSGTRLSCMDGIRLDFAHGFGVVRRSNTSHSLTVRFAGDTISELKVVQSRFVALCGLFDKDLAEQMAAIQAE